MLSIFRHYLQSQSNITILPNESPDDPSIVFRYCSFTYVFWHDVQKDPSYIRLMVPKIQTLSPSTNINDVYQLINTKNKEFKVAKAIIIDNDVWAVAESFVYSKENINTLFERLIQLLDQYVHEYHHDWKVKHSTTEEHKDETDTQ